MSEHDTRPILGISGAEAVDILGLSRQRVSQLAREERLPFVELDGQRFYRRHRVEVIANARRSRRERMSA